MREAALIAAMLAGCANAPPVPAPRLGTPVAEAAAARFDLDVFPDGRGLPSGRGNATQGAALFASQCAACHGARGRGASAEELVGGSEPLTSAYPDKTIGLYWPHATTLFDFIRRSKPMAAPGSLNADAVYALVAWLLASDGVIAADAELDAASLAAVRMPNRAGFIGIDAQPSPKKDDPAGPSRR
ncbi:MAG TPA: c-type cytochrome [Methylibium sp.]|uniref:c-type cytochrome n=1 Tax=Methylibium sp. TaxID=2067992 RepID=UPI002DBB3256|nr:c-type cytochrome [Methylibium sp.]HEU4460310.1 c-type cytochrome [Methylibium sp.]